ncbi:serine/threonine-protein phosphatase 7 long form-like protein [Senna tora]|uniref:Serine/threonine-protein phosphatase 7 long form-like protein n=1 Tax=Senna tora TaxID=362788 RepID=A0A834WS47_9FABA|nr:serine/threonine-protein phosphatase 7 long form-like protein [Senna tora]
MTLSQDHPKLDSDVIASFIISMVTLEPDVSVASIIERMNTQFQFEVSYKKAWLAKHKAITRVFGNWESSYSKLPRWMAAIQHFLPGTIVQFCYKPRPRGVPSDPNIRIFQRVFWEYKPCIDAFPHLKPMVQVDGTFLYGKYTQTLLIASSQDGNSNVVPLAFAIVEGETLEAWAWFLKRVRLHVVGERHNICLISARHPSILSAVSDPRTMWQPPYGHQVYCIRHLASNLNKKYNDSNLKDLFVNIGRPRTTRFQNEMDWDFHRMAVPRQTIIHPGPEDPSLLTLQNKHISEHVWQGYPERVLRCRRSPKDHPGLPPQPILNVLKQTGFYGVSRLRYFEFDNALVSALVERWRPETHTYHMPQGECTITLQDVAILLGLPCVGVPIVGRTDLPWATVCEGLLGQTPPEGKLKGQRSSMKWLDDTFSFANFPPNPTAVDIEHFARAYILKLIGGYLMPDKSSKEVYLMYLPLLADLTAVRTFSWGSACAMQPHFINPQLNVFGDLPPLGYRWTCIDVHYHQRYDTLKKYRLLLDSLKEDQIKWRPYDEDHVSQQIPHYCIDNRHIWLANVPLICFHIVEWQYSDRVLRQFDMDQPIPENPVDIDFLHTLKLTGNISANWFIEHQFYIHTEEITNHGISCILSFSKLVDESLQERIRSLVKILHLILKASKIKPLQKRQEICWMICPSNRNHFCNHLSKLVSLLHINLKLAILPQIPLPSNHSHDCVKRQFRQPRFHLHLHKPLVRGQTQLLHQPHYLVLSHLHEVVETIRGQHLRRGDAAEVAPNDVVFGEAFLHCGKRGNNDSESRAEAERIDLTIALGKAMKGAVKWVFELVEIAYYGKVRWAWWNIFGSSGLEEELESEEENESEDKIIR